MPPAKTLDHPLVPAGSGRGININAEVRAVPSYDFRRSASEMGWIRTFCLNMSLIDFDREIRFICILVELILVAAVRI